MADVIIVLRLMPVSPKSNLNTMIKNASELIKKAKGKVYAAKEKPIAFGLKAVDITFIMDENLGSTDKLEAKIAKVRGVTSCECIDVRRAVG